MRGGAGKWLFPMDYTTDARARYWQFIDRDDMPETELNPGQRRYVQAFLRYNGYLDVSLSERDLSTIFDLLSRAEEYDTEIKYDDLNWECSFAKLDRLGEMHVPVIERLLDQREKQGQVKRTFSNQEIWPNKKTFALCLTHDIDSVRRFVWRERLRALPHLRGESSIVKLRHFASMLFHIGGGLFWGRANRDFDLGHWLDVEAALGFKSTLFFVADELPDPGISDCFYSWNDRVVFDGKKVRLSEAVQEVHERGWEIGLHGSLASSKSLEVFEKEKLSVESYLGCSIVSTRQHYLCFDIARTPLIHSRAGIRSDSSIGSNVFPSFRAGTGLPFGLYDRTNDEETPVIEVPLIIQDVALSTMMGGNEHFIVRYCESIMAEVARSNGVLTILWHNDYLPGSMLFRAYEKILAKAHEMGAWGCTVSQLLDYCDDRGKIRLRDMDSK